MTDATQFYELEQGIIRLIRTHPDSPEMLLGISLILKDAFLADICLMVAGSSLAVPVQGVFRDANGSVILSYDHLEILLCDPWIGQLLAAQDPLAIGDLHGILEDAPIQPSSLSKMIPVRACLGIATNFKSHVNGMIIMGHKHPHEWTSQERELLKVASEPVAIAYSIAQPQRPAKSVSLDESPILKVWYEATRQRLEQQQQLNEQLTENLNKLIHNIITTMSDQTRNPLSRLRMGIEVLRSNRLPPEGQQQRLDILQQAWQELNDINQQILRLRDLQSQRLTFNPVAINLPQLMQEVLQLKQESWTTKRYPPLNWAIATPQTPQAEATSEPLPILHNDPEHLRNILVELLNNAGKFSVPNTTVTLSASVAANSDSPSIAITVTNEAACLSPEDQKYLFEPFYRVQSVIDSAVPGIGLGLSIVKGLVNLLQGKIEVSCLPSNPPEQCTIAFTLTFPVFPLQPS
jgi:signal transduction histidine kinase